MVQCDKCKENYNTIEGFVQDSVKVILICNKCRVKEILEQ